MKNKTLLILFLLIPCQIRAQRTEFTTQKQYFFEDYEEAMVFTKTNKRTKIKLNYNVLLDEMQYVQGNKKLCIENIDDIALIQFVSQSFVAYKGRYYKLIYDNNSKVYSRLIPNMSVLYKPSNGAYGASNETASTNKMSTLEEKKYYQLLLESNKSIEIKIPVYEKFFIFNKNHLIPLTKRTVYKLFPKRKAKIMEFVKSNKINLKNAEDIKTLFLFCEKS